MKRRCLRGPGFRKGTTTPREKTIAEERCNTCCRVTSKRKRPMEFLPRDRATTNGFHSGNVSPLSFPAYRGTVLTCTYYSALFAIVQSKGGRRGRGGGDRLQFSRSFSRHVVTSMVCYQSLAWPVPLSPNILRIDECFVDESKNSKSEELGEWKDWNAIIKYISCVSRLRVIARCALITWK